MLWFISDLLGLTAQEKCFRKEGSWKSGRSLHGCSFRKLVPFFTWWASYSRHRPLRGTPAFHTQPDEQGGLKLQTIVSLSWKSPSASSRLITIWFYTKTQTRVRLYRTHLDSDPGISGWLGSWEMSEPRSEWVEEEAARPEDDAFHPPHMQPHCTLRMSHYATLPWLWSQGRAYFPTAAHSRAYVHRSHSLAHGATASSPLRGKHSQAPRPLR